MLQRKRPGSEGSLSQQQQPPAKKTRPNQTRPAAANPAHNYSHLVTPTTAVTLTPATKHKSRSQHTPSLPRSSSPSPSLDLLPTTTSHSAALFSSAEGRDAQHQAVGAPPAAFPRAANVSPALSQLQFLLSSAHLTALTAPATARHLLRLMRHLAAEADIPSAQTVDERYCDACSTLLVPGISCKLKTRRDKQREEKWHEKQRQQRGRKQTKAAARQSGQQQDEQRVQEEAHGPTTAEGGSTQPSTRKQRHQAKRREEAVRRQKQSATDATAAGVTFVHAVNVCGRCGHQNVLPGTQRKRGGAQSKDVRKREGTDGKQPSAQRNIAAASAPSTSSEPPRKADKAREERQAKRKAQRRTQELKKQQSMSGGKPAIVTKAAGKAATAATTGPDPFVGSLFLKFQKQSKHGLEAAAAPATARPFSFTHPAAPSTPSSTPQPFIHTRAAPTPASSLTLLDQVAKQKKAQEKEQRKRAKQQQVETPAASKTASGGAGAVGGSGASGLSLGSGGLYGLLQSFQQ